MTDEMRKVTKKLRTKNSKPFYAMTEAAEFFKAPVSTMLNVYTALEKEGILSRIRGSRTMLNGKLASTRSPVRGVVGIPVGMDHLTLLPYTQKLLMELEYQLGRLGYIADAIFILPDFLTSLLRRNLDIVILQSPRVEFKQDILSLAERGIRLLIVQRTDGQFEVPGLIYLQDYETAYQVMAARWQQIGIRKVWLNTPSKYLYNSTEIERMRQIMNQHGMEAEAVGDEPSELLERVSNCKPGISGIAFLDCLHTELICNREPDVIENMSRVARVAFCLGRLRLPRLQFRKIRADFIELSPSEVASKLADDISRLAILTDGIRHTFRSVYHEQALI